MERFETKMTDGQFLRHGSVSSNSLLFFEEHALEKKEHIFAYENDNRLCWREMLEAVK
jgi:hypothetical protein